MTKAERAARKAHQLRIAEEFRTGIASLAYALARAIYWADKAHNPVPYRPDPRHRGIIN